MPKSGSTWLYTFLKTHPQCFVPSIKDLYFFDREYHRGLSWYGDFFEPGRGVPLRADISHDYIFHPHAAQRIHHDLGDCKIMICFRNPIEKEFSAYLFGKRNGQIQGSFMEGLKNGYHKPERCLYAKFLEQYESVFGRDRIHLAFFDDLKADPAGFARDFCTFTGLDFLPDYPYARKVLPASRPRSAILARWVKETAMAVRRCGGLELVGRIKSTPWVQKLLYTPYKSQDKPRISREEFHHLARFFERDIAQLEKMTGRDLSHWLERE